jgi:peptide/nickel transport system permease protein
MLTVAFIAFMLFQYVGDPVTNLLGQDATVEQRDMLRKDLGWTSPSSCSSAPSSATRCRGSSA